jgi:hypothetical protein
MPRIYATANTAEFTYSVSLKFPILDVFLTGEFHQTSLADSIEIFISTNNGINWDRAWKSNNSGEYTETISLSSYVNHLWTKIPTQNYLLKFVLHRDNISSVCGMDSLYVNTTFQASKFFLPQLKLGENTIEYTDSNGNDPNRAIEIFIEWQESFENKPPNKVTAPIFPLDQASVDSLYFAFTWEPATDDDGDAIVDYEFMLSDDARMLFPLSPNFLLYVSAFNEHTIRPYFKVKETGWLNHGETYYWRVRAKDARGVWSEWSDTWSFTPYGLMRPINGNAEIIEQSIRLSWERNPVGKQPDFYKVYASDEMKGFCPKELTFLGIADSTELIIPFHEKYAPYSFYRISACDTLGQESLISDVISIPYPYMYAAFDSVRADSLFSMNLFSNQLFYPYIDYVYLEDWYIPVITIEQKPNWLNDDSVGILYSTDSILARKLVYLDSSHRTIELLLDDGLGNVATQTILFQTAAINNKPELMISDSVVCENYLFSAYITSVDGDVDFGDTNFYTILQKPDWLNFEISGDTVFLFGTPIGGEINGLTLFDSLLRILAVDTKNDSTEVEFLIRITPRLQILSEIRDTTLQDEFYTYSLLVNRKEDEFSNIVFSFQNLPNWLQFDRQNLISGTPSIYHLSDTILHFSAFDNVCNMYSEHQAIITITHVNSPPVIVTKTLHDALENYPYFAEIMAYDIDTLVEDVILTYTLNPNDSWLSINGETGMLHGTPLRENIFTDTAFTVTVCDQHGACDSVRYQIHIEWFNNAPELVLIDNPVCEDDLYIGFITSVCGDVLVGDTHIYIPLLLPKWLGVSINGDTVFLEGVPTEQDLNDTIVRILAMDRKNEITIEEFSIQLVPKLKIRSTPTDTAIVGSLYIYNLDISSEVEYADFSVIQRPSWLDFNADFSFSGIPNLSHLNDTLLHFTIDDNQCNGQAEQKVSIAVFHINTPPVIVTTTLPDALENDLYVTQIMAYDVDSLFEDVILVYTLNPNTSWLSINSENGLLHGTPLRENIFVDTAFTITVCDQHGGCDSKRYQIHIDWYNHAPELILVDEPTHEDSLYFGFITSICGDVFVGDTHIYVPLLLPQWLGVSISGDTVFLEGIPQKKDLSDTIIQILAIDRKNEITINEFSIRLIPNIISSIVTPISGNCSVQIFKSQSGITYYVQVQSAKQLYFQYRIYSVYGKLLYSSSNKNLTEGTHHLALDILNTYPSGIYIFEGIENNQIRYTIKFVK